MRDKQRARARTENAVLTTHSSIRPVVLEVPCLTRSLPAWGKGTAGMQQVHDAAGNRGFTAVGAAGTARPGALPGGHQLWQSRATTEPLVLLHSTAPPPGAVRLHVVQGCHLGGQHWDPQPCGYQRTCIHFPLGLGWASGPGSY